MERSTFKEFFNAKTSVVLPVVHVIDKQQAEVNIQRAMDVGCPGVFLINHDFGVDEFLPIIRHTREKFPNFWIALNFLAVTGKDAFPILARLESEGVRIDGYWGDDARIDEFSDPNNQSEADEILAVKKDCGWNGMYFGGTCFKKQREVLPEHYATSAELATHFMDVVTTSGVATGHAADTDKIEIFRRACGETAIALASGITPENVHQYTTMVDCLMVATGINLEDDFYNIDPKRLEKLMQILREEVPHV